MLIPLKEYAAKVGINYGAIRNAIMKKRFVPDKKIGQHWYVEEDRIYPNKKRGDKDPIYNSCSSLHNIWSGMKKRCYNPNYEPYPRYGGRGIKVCEEWLHNYEAFKEWALSHGYEIGLTIDRIDNDGNYEPANCQWLTRSENSRKGNRPIEQHG